MNLRELCVHAARSVRLRAGERLARREPSLEDWIRAEIRAVCMQIDQADQVFNCSTDPDLIDSSIFIMRACERRLGYLFKQAKTVVESKGAERAPRRNQASVLP
ncbi:MAG: hypothetical protein VB144_13120 [Clostridia bacterium]|nr:hypothetical protein [Clostridia bacterium]